MSEQDKEPGDAELEDDQPGIEGPAIPLPENDQELGDTEAAEGDE